MPAEQRAHAVRHRPAGVVVRFEHDRFGDLVAVAEARHFTKAAKELGISQPPLSQQIQRLEREIGTPLFRRLTRGVELTEAGESFYEDACQILALSDAALEKAQRHYRRFGCWSLLLSWSPVIGDPLTLIAGVMREPLWRFLLLVTLALATSRLTRHAQPRRA